MSAATGAATVVDAGADRARLLSDVRFAGGILAQAWPLETFIAVNPLGGLETLPFGEAVNRAGDALGARGTLDEDAFRKAHAVGRITDADLISALARRFPEALEMAPVAVPGRSVEPVEILLCDLLNGSPAPPPRRHNRTISEEIAAGIAGQVDDQTAKWCAAFLDAGEAGWQMPGREEGFFKAWRDLAPRDRSLPAEARDLLRQIPERPDDSVLASLNKLGVSAGVRREYLQAHITRMPGWAAHVRWHGEHGGEIDLVSYLAMRLAYEAELLDCEVGPEPAVFDPVDESVPSESNPADQRAAEVASHLGLGSTDFSVIAGIASVLGTMSQGNRALAWLDAYEGNYRDTLLDELSGPPAEPAAERPEVQLVCCIDARSEGLRRHFEETGPYETLGFAGFFAVAIRYQDLAGGEASSLCPVLLEARNQITELPAGGADGQAERQLAGRRAMAGSEDSFHAAKDDLAGPFVLAETAGWVAGPLAAAKTLFSGAFGSLRDRLDRRVAPSAPTVLSVSEGFTFEERALFSEVALTMMGLTGPFGRLVVLCGHGSTTENNPYEAALDCGACGGNRGAPNARTAAAILNGPDVREHLREKGIEIPEDTWFVAAEHDTATDRVTLLDRHLVPEHYSQDVDRLDRDLDTAGDQLSAERCASMPGAPESPSPASAARHVRSRSSDWAQVFPEWGLAGNAAFVVGPRSITRGIDLGRRTFLHSYEAEVDSDGEALETILTAPMVVAQWINCQYYFSTVDPIAFGAGTKTVHNVVGGVGVLAGHGGDLQLGLPWQSVADGDRLIHEPMRLLTIVQAPLERIDEIIARNTVLQQLFGNEWVALAARADAGDTWMRHTPHGWQSWTDPEVTLDEPQ